MDPFHLAHGYHHHHHHHGGGGGMAMAGAAMAGMAMAGSGMATTVVVPVRPGGAQPLCTAARLRSARLPGARAAGLPSSRTGPRLPSARCPRCLLSATGRPRARLRTWLRARRPRAAAARWLPRDRLPGNWLSDCQPAGNERTGAAHGWRVPHRPADALRAAGGRPAGRRALLLLQPRVPRPAGVCHRP